MLVTGSSRSFMTPPNNQYIRVDGRLLQAIHHLTLYLQTHRDQPGLLLLARMLRLLASYFEACETIQDENVMLRAEIQQLKSPSLGRKGENNGPTIH
jgi:hypothetical protein